MKIGIVGGGVVGKATARVFMEWADVMVYDIREEKATHGLDETIAADLVFICLPTPKAKDGLACDTSYVEDFCNMLGGSRPNGSYIIRSTVPIGFTRRMSKEYGLPNLIHNPEFLTARCSFTDAQCPSRNIIGVPNLSEEDRRHQCWESLYRLYTRRFTGVSVHLMTSDESEAVKLLQNSFFAVKVSFWNECQAIASKLGLNWKTVMEGVLADGRIAHAHTKVPGPDGAGFRGTCLPKDIANLANTALQLVDKESPLQRVYPRIMLAAIERNAIDIKDPMPGVPSV